MRWGGENSPREGPWLPTRHWAPRLPVSTSLGHTPVTHFLSVCLSSGPEGSPLSILLSQKQSCVSPNACLQTCHPVGGPEGQQSVPQPHLVSPSVPLSPPGLWAGLLSLRESLLCLMSRLPLWLLVPHLFPSLLLKDVCVGGTSLSVHVYVCMCGMCCVHETDSV